MIKRIIFLSLITGAILAILALLPFVVKVSVFLLMFAVSLVVLIYLQRTNVLTSLILKDTLIIGSVSGFVSFIGFSIIFIPLVYLLSLFVPISYMGGFVLMLKLSNFGLLVMFTLFLSIISVMFNAFSAFLWYCLCNRGGNNLVQNSKTFEQQLNENINHIQ